MRHLSQVCTLLILLVTNTLFNGAEGQLLNMPLPELPENQEILVSEVTLAPHLIVIMPMFSSMSWKVE